MIRKGMTTREACERWVREFNAVPQGMIAALMNADVDSWQEVTMPAYGDRVYVYDVEGDENRGEIVKVREPSDEDEDNEVLYEIKLDDGKTVFARKEDFELDYDDCLPMWGTMWSFDDRCDEYWLDEQDGIRIMSECGFRIYEHEEFGYFFGIDGAGYNFYEEHWIPLYKARGLQWHDKSADAAEYMIEQGRRNTESGNYHFSFDEIVKQFGTKMDEQFKSDVKEYVFDKYSYMVAELDVTEDFDFMFYLAFCPNAEE